MLPINNPETPILKKIITDIYDLDSPGTDSDIRSIIIVASPSSSSVKIIFTWQGDKIPLTLPAGYIDNTTAPEKIGNYLNKSLNPVGYYIKAKPGLPRKLLAVRSGLGLYGRNNLCYVDGMGSFLNLSPYLSNIPCTEESWHDLRQMDICKTCQACIKHCPTGAITKKRFLINNERCLTYFNETRKDLDFPRWIDSSAHNSIYGCSGCQMICPANRPYLDNISEPVEFTEEETLLLITGKAVEYFPAKLKHKIKELDMRKYLDVLPRNLKVLFNNISMKSSLHTDK